MHSIQFWKSWPVIFQRIGLIPAAALIFSISLTWIWYIQSPAPTITSYHSQELIAEQIPVSNFSKGPFDLTVTGDNFIIFDKLLGDRLQPNMTATYIFIACYVIALVVLLAIATALSRFWYLVAMGLFILLIVSMRLEIVQLFGTTTKIFPIAFLSAFVLTSFYFHAVRSSASFTLRLLAFAILTVATCVIVYFFSETAQPFLHIAGNSYISATIITIIFIITVAHEILASFVYVASQGTQIKSLNHFLIISAIYMVNLLILYFHKIGYITWDFLYIDLILLISISGVLGLWGFRLREPQYDRIITADPFGVYFYLAFATIAFSTIGYFIGTGNDPALQTVYDIIIYSHIGFGIIFLTYVISNFIGMLAENIPVHKVLYKPNRMPYFTFRFGGVIATLAFVFYNTWQVPVNNAYGGYYNTKGDLYLSMNNPRLAEAYYKQAAGYGFLNHHSNYALANIEEGRYNSFEARSYYGRASGRRPTVQSFLNESDMYERVGQYFDALYVLQEARQHFPESGDIENAIGLIYSKLNVYDSAFYYLHKAMRSSEAEVSANGNFIGLVASSRLALSADSLLNLAQSSNPGIQSNALALANIHQNRIDVAIDLSRDTVLDLFSASRLSNYMINHIGHLDSAFIAKAIRVSRQGSIGSFVEPLLFTCSMALYEEGRIGEAFDLLEEVTMRADDQSKYNNILAMWALEQDAPQVALEFLRYTTNADFEIAGVTSAIAHAEAFHHDAAQIWDSLRNFHPDSAIRQSAVNVTKVFSVGRGAVPQLDDNEKYMYCRYRIPPLDTVQLDQIARTISDSEMKAQLYIERCEQLLELDLLQPAISTYQKIRGLAIGKELYAKTQLLELKLLALVGNFGLLQSMLSESSIDFNEHVNDRIFFDAILANSRGDTITAKRQFNRLTIRNPYDEAAVIAAANFFRRHSSEGLRAYNILADALLENPFSVRILKAYSLEAARNGFDLYAFSAIERLQPLLPEPILRRFLIENKDTFNRALLQQ